MVFSSQASSNHGSSMFILPVSNKVCKGRESQQNFISTKFTPRPNNFSEGSVNHPWVTRRTYICLFLFVSFGFFFPLENFSLIWSRHDHHYRWRAANFDLWSAFMAIEQRGFFSVPHLLWNGASVYNGHLRGPPWHSLLLLSGWQWNCPYLFYNLGLSRLEFEHPTFRLRCERSDRLGNCRGTEIQNYRVTPTLKSFSHYPKHVQLQETMSSFIRIVGILQERYSKLDKKVMCKT